MDLHAMGGGYYSRGATIVHNAVFWGGYCSREATVRGGLLNKGGVYSRNCGKYCEWNAVQIIEGSENQGLDNRESNSRGFIVMSSCYCIDILLAESKCPQKWKIKRNASLGTGQGTRFRSTLKWSSVDAPRDSKRAWNLTDLMHFQGSMCKGWTNAQYYIHIHLLTDCFLVNWNHVKFSLRLIFCGSS